MNSVSLTQTYTQIKVCLSFLPKLKFFQSRYPPHPPKQPVHLREMDLRAASRIIEYVCVDNLHVSLSVNQSVFGCRAGH